MRLGVEIGLTLLLIIATRYLPSPLLSLVYIAVATCMIIVYRELAPSHLLFHLDNAVASQELTRISAIEGNRLPDDPLLLVTMSRENTRIEESASQCRRMHLDMLQMNLFKYATHIFKLRESICECMQLVEDQEYRIKAAVEDEHQARCAERRVLETELVELYDGRRPLVRRGRE